MKVSAELRHSAPQLPGYGLGPRHRQPRHLPQLPYEQGAHRRHALRPEIILLELKKRLKLFRLFSCKTLKKLPFDLPDTEEEEDKLCVYKSKYKQSLSYLCRTDKWKAV